MQIRPKLIEEGDMVGEFDITDYCLGFDEEGPLRHLNVHWEAIIHFCKTLDAAQHEAKHAIDRALANTPTQDAETSFVLTGELEAATLAEETLVKATVFIVLCSFKEFALKELYSRLEDAPAPPIKRGFKHIKRTLVEKTFWPDAHDSHGQLSEATYESIRNNFAHGDWTALKENLPTLELHDAFGELAGFLREIVERMRAKRLNV